MTRWGYTALHQALRRDNALTHIESMLDRGADPTLAAGDGLSGVSIAARRGRGDVLRALEQRNLPVELNGVERLIAACARDDAAAMQMIAEREPSLVRALLDQGGTLLARFAGTANAAGARRLLDLGVPVDACTGRSNWNRSGQYRAPRRRLARLAPDRAHADRARRASQQAR
jgi:hypothetical protein